MKKLKVLSFVFVVLVIFLSIILGVKTSFNDLENNLYELSWFPQKTFSLKEDKEISISDIPQGEYQYSSNDEYALINIKNDKENEWYKFNNKTLTLTEETNLDNFSFEDLREIRDNKVRFSSGLNESDFYFDLLSDDLNVGGNINSLDNYRLNVLETDRPVMGDIYDLQVFINDNENPTYDKTDKKTAPWDKAPSQEVIYADQDHLVVKNNDIGSGDKTKFGYINYSTKNSIEDITYKNKDISSFDPNSFSTINSMWINNIKNKSFIKYDVSTNTFEPELYFYDELYGRYLSDFEILKKDNKFYLFKLDEGLSWGELTVKIELPFLEGKTITNYKQTNKGNYYFIIDNGSNQKVYFLDTTSSWFKKEPIYSQIFSFSSKPTKLFYALDYFFVYEYNDTIYTKTFPWINNVNYKGDYFFNENIYLDQDISFQINNSQIASLFVNDKMIEKKHNVYEIFLDKKEFIEKEYRIKIKFNNGKMDKIVLPKIIILSDYNPNIVVNNVDNGNNITPYVTNDIEVDQKDTSNFLIDDFSSSYEMNASIEGNSKALIKEVNLDGKIVDKEKIVISDIGYHKLDIKDNFGKEWIYQFVIVGSSIAKPVNYFDTEEGKEVREVAIENGYSKNLDFYYKLNSLQVNMLIDHLGTLFKLNDFVEDAGSFANFLKNFQTKLIDWYGDKIPLNRIKVDDIKNNISFDKVLKTTFISSVEDFFHCEIEDIDKELSFNYSFNDNKNYLNQNTKLTISRVEKSHFLGSIKIENIPIDLIFNYYNLDKLNDNQDFTDMVFENLNQFYSEKSFTSETHYGELKLNFYNLIIDTINEYDNGWSSSPSKDLNDDKILLQLSDVNIVIKNKEKNISDSTTLGEVDYFRINLSVKHSKESIAYQEIGKTTNIKVKNNNYIRHNVFYNFKGFFILLLIIIIALFILLIIFIVRPWVIYWYKNKNLENKKNKY